MLRSHSNTLVSVERVTELNTGGATAGVDGQVALTDEARMDLIEGESGHVFTDEVIATTILDRFLHHCDAISINGPSWRLKDRLSNPEPTETETPEPLA